MFFNHWSLCLDGQLLLRRHEWRGDDAMAKFVAAHVHSLVPAFNRVDNAIDELVAILRVVEEGHEVVACVDQFDESREVLQAVVEVKIGRQTD
jgi:hypothetical protein